MAGIYGRRSAAPRARPGGRTPSAARRSRGAIRVHGLAGVRRRAYVPRHARRDGTGPRLLLRPGGVPGPGRAPRVAGLADAGDRGPQFDPGLVGNPAGDGWDTRARRRVW